MTVTAKSGGSKCALKNKNIFGRLMHRYTTSSNDGLIISRERIRIPDSVSASGPMPRGDDHTDLHTVHSGRLEQSET